MMRHVVDVTSLKSYVNTRVMCLAVEYVTRSAIEVIRGT